MKSSNIERRFTNCDELKIIFVDSSLIQIQAIFSSSKSIKIHLKSLNLEAIDELLSNI